MRKGSYEFAKPGCRVHDVLGDDIASGRVRIVDWFEAEPMAVLESGTVGVRSTTEARIRFWRR